jgi:hypothetical protein
MEVIRGPLLDGMGLQLEMTRVASIVAPATFKLDRNDVKQTVVMRTARVVIEIKPVNFCIVDKKLSH